MNIANLKQYEKGDDEQAEKKHIYAKIKNLKILYFHLNRPKNDLTTENLKKAGNLLVAKQIFMNRS